MMLYMIFPSTPSNFCVYFNICKHSDSAQPHVKGLALPWDCGYHVGQHSLGVKMANIFKAHEFSFSEHSLKVHTLSFSSKNINPIFCCKK